MPPTDLYEQTPTAAVCAAGERSLYIMEKVKFGIIGMGNMGTVHLDFFMKGKIKNGTVTAVSDKDPKRLAMAKSKLPGDYECFGSGDELIEKADVDAVIIAVPHYAHPELTIKALKKGLNVVCEKPAGVYTKQVKEMNEVASGSKKLFTMMYNQRTNPLYIKMHDIIENGEIGDIRRINWIITNWFRTQYYYDSGSWRATWKGEGGGVLMNQCPHQLDLLQWITGMMPKHVRAFCHFGKWHDMETEDDVTAYMEFENGATGAFITTTADAPGTNRLEILGSRGKLICEKDELTVYRLDCDLQDFLKTEQSGFTEPKYTSETVKQYGDNPQHVGILNNFANAVLGLEPLYVDGREGLKCVELINSMLLSSWTESTVTLPIDDDLYLTELNKRIAASSDKSTRDILIDNTMSFGGTK